MLRLCLLLFLALLSLGAQETKKVLITNLPPTELAELRKVAPPNVRLVTATGATFMQELADADGLIGSLNAQQFGQAKKLKWVQTLSAGVDNLMFPAMVNSDVAVTNAKIVMGPNIADHAFAMLLAITRKINVATTDKGGEVWRRGTYANQLVELEGKTALIIGMGGIGMQIAQRAKGFGMTVLGVDPKDIPLSVLVDEMAHPDQLNEMIPRADVVFVAAPLTPASRGMMGPDQFDRMKKNSYFIAVSRGPLYQTPALVKALDSNQIAGAGLDVTDPEPLPPGHALWKFPNVVITPHVAGQGDGMPGRRLEVIKENVRRFGEGRPLLNLVNKQAGY
jgi:phosphoglycerate dehydrogenase-like enzyme